MVSLEKWHVWMVYVPCHRAVQLSGSGPVSLRVGLPLYGAAEPLSSALYFDGFLICQAIPRIVFNCGASIQFGETVLS